MSKVQEILQPTKDILTSLFTKFDVTGQVNGKALTALAAFGAYYAAYYLSVPLVAIWRHALRPRRALTTRYGGQWAVVTGASDGIGEEYSYELARSGFNIVLVSRTAEKLEAVASRLRANYGVQTRIVQFDFATLSSPEAVADLYAKLDTATKDIDVCVLANNAGKAHANLIHDHSVDICFNMVNVNVNT